MLVCMVLTLALTCVEVLSIFFVYIAFAICMVYKSEGCYHRICHRVRVLNGVLYNVKGV